MSYLWYKNAIIYSLDVETFKDANGDGIGDFPGLTQRLDYLAGLGVNCLWLLPFHASPNRDNGYDVMDYYSVDPCLGTLGDFVEFVHQARERGIRIIVDLVVNHTSNQHPWFQAARSNRDSKYRHYYVWAETPPETSPDAIAFPTVEDSAWEYDETAGAYYLHHFYKEQPDLNINNPDVREEIRKIMGFWLELGVSGFRIDAAPFLIKNIDTKDGHAQDLPEFLTEMRQFVELRRPDAILLAEANVPPEQIEVYFNNSDRMHILFNFLLNQDLFLALARQDATPLQEGIKRLPPIPERCQWLNFLRHHDELTLDRLSPEEREEIYQVFAPDETMRIFDRGIRRRLAPMLRNDRRWIELAFSLLFTLPGTPMLRYGEEIGMGDDLSLEGRDSVRTPMQWSDCANGGFSAAERNAMPHQVITEGEYGCHQVNVMRQQREAQSLLNWIGQMLRIRKQYPELGRGEWHLIDVSESCVFAHCCEWEGKTIVALHNLADRACEVTLKSHQFEQLIEVFNDQNYEPLAERSKEISLDAYGYRWFRTSVID